MTPASPRGVAPQDARRTFVISDAHGHPELILKALDDGGFVPGRDGFIYAGDFLDRGPDPAGCLDLLDRFATEVLVGNHELAAMLDFGMCGTDPESRSFRPLLIDRVLNGAWKAAIVCQGVVVTHAGVSSHYQAVAAPAAQNGRVDPELLAAHINQEFLTAVRRELETGDWDEDGIFGRSGPLWYRPTWSPLLPLEGVRQVSGHTPPQPQLEADGFWMVDPCVWMSSDSPRAFRYAVIEDGEVSVVERDLRRAVA